MAITFPLALTSLSDLLPVQSVDWSIMRFEDTSDLGTGEFLTHQRGPSLVAGDVTLVPMSYADGEIMRARLAALDGSGQTFYLTNKLNQYPAGDPTGALIAGHSPVIASINANRKALTVSGLPAAYALTLGDWFHIVYDTSRRMFVQIMESIVANGSGVTGEFEVRPHLRAAVVVANVVGLAKPAAKVKIVPGSLRISSDTAFTRISFSVRQTLAA